MNLFSKQSHSGHLKIARPSVFPNGSIDTSSFIGVLHHWHDTAALELFTSGIPVPLHRACDLTVR
jgi:hypothetical protein